MYPVWPPARNQQVLGALEGVETVVLSVFGEMHTAYYVRQRKRLEFT